ncbi:MAG: energy transducer TonB [Candidatus Omnitrophica bacterium]|nr:energy transducer TonB [Candidatus Omnitrophota bacterium]
MTLKGALIWSGLIHVGLLMARPPAGLAVPRAAIEPLEVSYLGVEPKNNFIPPPPVQFAPMKSGNRTERVEPITSSGPMSRPEPRVEFQKREAAVPMEKPAAPVVSPAPAAFSTTAAVALPEWQFAVIQHKEQVRTHLKPRLRYPTVQVEGTVRLRLHLTAEGLLQRAEVLAASDPRLTEAALRDTQAAAPYPRFSSSMRRRTATYEFLVRYQPE